MMDVSYFEDKLAALVEQRKKYETPFDGLDSVLKNRIRLRFLDDVDANISNLKLEKTMLQDAESGVEVAMTMCVFHGHIPMWGRDGDTHHVSMKKSVMTRYDDIIQLNLDVAKECDMTVTDYIQYVTFDAEMKRSQRSHRSWMIRGNSPIQILEPLDFSIIKAEFTKIVQKRRFKFFYEIFPFYMLNDNNFNNIFHEYRFNAKMC